MFLPLEKTKKKKAYIRAFFSFYTSLFFLIFQAYEGHSDIFKLKI